MTRPGNFAPISKRLKGRTPSAEVERSIVDAAERLLVDRGPDALTVRGIASAAGVAPMGVYNHLGDKQGVLDALLVRGFDGLGAVMLDIATDDPYEDLLEAGRRYRQYAREHPAHYALMFERSDAEYEPSDLALEHAAVAFRALETLVRRAISAGVLADADPAEVAQALWSAVHGSVSLELHGIGFCPNIPLNQELTAAALLRGLRSSD
ncbi:MAG: TetR/AcrR family transcriptional regulator [Microthrixaceae bacterium]